MKLATIRTRSFEKIEHRPVCSKPVTQRGSKWQLLHASLAGRRRLLSPAVLARSPSGHARPLPQWLRPRPAGLLPFLGPSPTVTIWCHHRSSPAVVAWRHPSGGEPREAGGACGQRERGRSLEHRGGGAHKAGSELRAASGRRPRGGEAPILLQ